MVAAIDGSFARLVPCAHRPVLFLVTVSGVVGLEVGVVVCARRNLAVVRRTHQYGNLVLGVLEDGAGGVAGGVAGAGAFKCDLKADVEEVLLESDDMVVVWSAQAFCSIVARLCEEAGDLDNGSHGDDAGIEGEGARWLLGGASVRSSVGLSVRASVGLSLSQ